LVNAIDIGNETFIERNFTPSEQQYCHKASDPQASFAGTWSAKEAVFKSLNVASLGGGASLLDIEIVRNQNGAPEVTLHGKALEAAQAAGVNNVKVSISHDENQSVAVAIANK